MTPHLTHFDDGGGPPATWSTPTALHFSLSALDPNGVLRMLCAAVGDIIRTHVILVIDPFDIRELIDDDHPAIVEAVLDGDAEAARDAMRHHIVQLDPIYRSLGRQPVRPRRLEVSGGAGGIR